MSTQPSVHNEIGDVRQGIFNFRRSPKEVGRALARLSVTNQSLVVRAAYRDLMTGVKLKQYHNTAESAGHRLELVLLEVGEPQQLIERMAAEGNAEIILNVVRGHAGEYSAIAEHLTVDLLVEMFATDAYQKFESRRIYMTYTLICETDYDNQEINRFFSDHYIGQSIMRLILDCVEKDENAACIWRIAKTERGITEPPEIRGEEDEFDDEDILAPGHGMHVVDEDGNDVNTDDVADDEDDDEDDDW